MPLNVPPRPWKAVAHREIGDADGNVVQYTEANIGMMCLAVNAYDRLEAALAAVDEWLNSDPATRMSDKEMRVALAQARNRIGLEALGAMVEGITQSTDEIDRKIAHELQVPELRYTSSIDAALSLVPPGWSYRVSSKDQFFPDTAGGSQGRTEQYHMIDMTGPNGVSSGTSKLFPVAITAAAIRARDVR